MNKMNILNQLNNIEIGAPNIFRSTENVVIKISFEDWDKKRAIEYLFIN